jgi:hypothetical protein
MVQMLGWLSDPMRFTLETGAGFDDVERRRQELPRDVTAEARVLGFVDDAHSAYAVCRMMR